MKQAAGVQRDAVIIINNNNVPNIVPCQLNTWQQDRLEYIMY